MQLPIGSEADFVGVVDLVEMRRSPGAARRKLGEEFDIEDIPGPPRPGGRVAREAARNPRRGRRRDRRDLPVREEITAEQIKAGIRNSPRRSEIYPVLSGSAFKNKGVQPMLDAVSTTCRPRSTSASRGRPHGRCDARDPQAHEAEPLSALAFKIATHPLFGKLTFVRIYSGGSRTAAGPQLDQGPQGAHRKIYQMHANKEEPRRAGAGDIFALLV